MKEEHYKPTSDHISKADMSAPDDIVERGISSLIKGLKKPTKEEYVSQSEYLQQFMYDFLDTSDRRRAFGRTTLLKDTIIRLLLDNVGEWITIRDHHPNGDCELARNIIDKLSYKEIDVYGSKVLPIVESKGVEFNTRSSPQIRVSGFKPVDLNQVECKDK